jgi:TolB protein
LTDTRLLRPSALVSNVSPVLDELLVWLLQIDPGRRPRSAAAARAWIDQHYRSDPQPQARSLGVALSIAAVVCVLIAVVWIFGSRAAGGSPNPGQVVFTSSRTGSYELYVAAGPNAPPAQIAALPGDAFAPAWSPDGQQIVYVRLLDENHDIYRVNVDGTENQPVAASLSTEATPAWAPDGQRIAFSSDHTGDYELYTVATNGAGGWTPLTARPGVDRSPVWIDDGQLLYIAQRGQAWGLYRLTLADSTDALVYLGAGELTTLARSPDGGRLAFAMRDQTDNIDIYTIAINGTDLKRLTTDPAEDSYPSWSPDGAQLTFQTKRDDTGIPNAAQLYIIKGVFALPLEKVK